MDSITYRVRTNSKILDPELLYDIDELNAEQKQNNNPDVDHELIKKNGSLG